MCSADRCDGLHWPHLRMCFRGGTSYRSLAAVFIVVRIPDFYEPWNEFGALDRNVRLFLRAQTLVCFDF